MNYYQVFKFKKKLTVAMGVNSVVNSIYNIYKVGIR